MKRQTSTCDSIATNFTKLDAFGRELNFMMNNTTKSKTVLGAMATIMLGILIFSYTISRV